MLKYSTSSNLADRREYNSRHFSRYFKRFQLDPLLQNSDLDSLASSAGLKITTIIVTCDAGLAQ